MKTIIDMAREAGFVEYELEDYTQSGYDIRYERFAALIRADEREACANLCDALAVHPEYASEVTKLAAMAIRARGNT